MKRMRRIPTASGVQWLVFQVESTSTSLLTIGRQTVGRHRSFVLERLQLVSLGTFSASRTNRTD